MSWSSQKPKRVVRDFHRRRYGNPLFKGGSGSSVRGRASQGSGRSDGSNRGVAITLVSALAVGGVCYVLWGPALRVNAIEVHGTVAPHTQEVIKNAIVEYADGTAFGIFPRRSVLIFSSSAARAAVESKVFLEHMTIDKRLPRTIVVEAEEKVPKAVLERDGRLYALDAGGFMLRELADVEMSAMVDLPAGITAVPVPGLGAESVAVSPDAAAPKEGTVPEKDAAPARNPLPLIIDEREGQSDRPGTQAAPASTVALILEAYGRLPDIVGDTVRWFTPGEDGRSVTVTTGAGWKIHLSTAIPFDAQAERLGIVLKEKIGDRRPQLEYVDLRYNERIYFRMKGEAQE